jgi:hypothetical protein
MSNRNKVVWGLLVTLVFVSALLFAMYRFGSGISFWAKEVESSKTEAATVTSVGPVQKANSSTASRDVVLYRICYVIDDFDQIHSDFRQGYWSAESQRLLRDGPRCKVTPNVALAKNLSKGDRISVVFLIGNQYQIDIVAVSALGENL